MAKRGIDISAHNGNIDLEALKSQIDFVIIRVGYGTKGTIDQKFKRNVELCEKIGLPYGFYWYSYALDTDGAMQEANAFLNAIEPYHPTYGCWFDMEDADGYKKRNGMPSNNELKDICYAFCELVEDAGYYSGIYASLSWFNNQLSGDKLARFDKWVAQWPTKNGKQRGLSVKSDEKSGWSLWQFTSEGKFSGYSGRLDVNYAYKSFSTNHQPTPTTPSGSIFELALGTMQGKYGMGEERKQKLGTKYEEVQNFINHIYSAPVDTVAKEVISNKYGVGDQRKILLGNRYDEIQQKVNQLLNKPIIYKKDKVKFTGTRSYSGLKLSDWTHNQIFDVIQVSGDRVVIGKGSEVTAAVNIKDCQKV